MVKTPEPTGCLRRPHPGRAAGRRWHTHLTRPPADSFPVGRKKWGAEPAAPLPWTGRLQEYYVGQRAMDEIGALTLAPEDGGGGVMTLLSQQLLALAFGHFVLMLGGGVA